MTIRERSGSWVGQTLVNRIEEVATGAGWRGESTGLHETQFIKTQRHRFTSAVAHNTLGGVNALNLIKRPQG